MIVIAVPIEAVEDREVSRVTAPDVVLQAVTIAPEVEENVLDVVTLMPYTLIPLVTFRAEIVEIEIVYEPIEAVEDKVVEKTTLEPTFDHSAYE